MFKCLLAPKIKKKKKFVLCFVAHVLKILIFEDHNEKIPEKK